MARLNSFSRVVAAWVIGLHLVLLPALYYAVGYVIRTSHEELFVENARTFARVLADEFELGAAMESPSRTEDLLDLAIVNGDGRYAELIEGGTSIRSRLSAHNIVAPRSTDLHFDEDGDDVYFVVLPIVHGTRNAELRVGFDEQPTLDRIHMAQRRLLALLGTYFSVAMVIAVVLSYRLSRPIQRLQDVSRTIASGDYVQSMQVSTGIRELHDLASDLEKMRSELVGVNQRLQAQIREKEASELRREELQRQLRQKQRLETVGTLAGGVAHEFNNVLVPIILFTDMALQDLPESSSSRADLERVLAAARRAKDVVKKILTFSRELGESKLTAIDMRAVLNDGLNLLTALGPPSIEIRTQIAEAIPLIRADATLALHLVVNLCTNAFQAMQGENGVLTIGLRPLPASARDAAPQVEFWVSDTGHGMSASTVERIFEPFFTTRSVGQGTGLGLSVVHGIVESFGGSIKVESEPEKGSTFRVFFPVYSQSEHPEDAVTAD
jgi:signal transduction histidine kinase